MDVTYHMPIPKGPANLESKFPLRSRKGTLSPRSDSAGNVYSYYNVFSIYRYYFHGFFEALLLFYSLISVVTKSGANGLFYSIDHH